MLQPMPEVSVVTPTYLRPRLLRHALDAVVPQTFGDFEVLVCDNGNDPETRDVVESYRDSRLRYIPRPENLGMLRNAVLGFEDASAPLVMKLDDDDILHPTALEELVTPFRGNEELSLSFGAVRLIDGDGQPLDQLTATLDRSSGRAWFPEGILRPATWVIARGGVQLAGAVLRKSLVNWRAIPDDVATAYDFYLALKAVENDRPVYFTQEPVVSYRIHSGADTVRRPTPQALATVAVLERALREGRHGDVEALEGRLTVAALEAGRCLVHDGDLPRARQLLRRSLALQPTPTARRLLAATYVPGSVVARMLSARRTTTDRLAAMQSA